MIYTNMILLYWYDMTYILICFFYNNMMWYILIWFLSWAGAGPDPPSDSQGVSLRFFFPSKNERFFGGNVFVLCFLEKLSFWAGFFTNLPSCPPLQSNPLHFLFQSTPPPIHLWDQYPTILNPFGSFLGPKDRTGVCIYDRDDSFPMKSAIGITVSPNRSLMKLSRLEDLCSSRFFWVPGNYGPGNYGPGNCGPDI